MQFLYNDFECDIEVFVKDKDYVFRVFDRKKGHKEYVHELKDRYVPGIVSSR